MTQGRYLFSLLVGHEIVLQSERGSSHYPLEGNAHLERKKDKKNNAHPGIPDEPSALFPVCSSKCRDRQGPGLAIDFETGCFLIRFDLGFRFGKVVLVCDREPGEASRIE